MNTNITTDIALTVKNSSDRNCNCDVEVFVLCLQQFSDDDLQSYRLRHNAQEL